MALRTVTGRFEHPDGQAWAGGKVSFQLIPGSYTADVHYPRDVKRVALAEDGGFSIRLWCDAEGLTPTKYVVQGPDSAPFFINLAYGDGTPVELGVLRASSVISPQVSREAAFLAIRALLLAHTGLKASASNLGHVRIGQHLEVNSEGVLSVSANLVAQIGLAEPAIVAGTTAQYWRGDKSWQPLNKGAVGLGNVDNTSDANKPISNLAQAALNLKAPLASPALTGTPTAPTAAPGANSTQLATTAFVRNEVAAIVGSAPGALDTLNELAAALGNDANFASTVTASLGGKQPLSEVLTDLAGPSRTGFARWVDDTFPAHYEFGPLTDTEIADALGYAPASADGPFVAAMGGDSIAYQANFPISGTVLSVNTANSNAAPFELVVFGVPQGGALGVNPVLSYGYNSRRTLNSEPSWYQNIEARWNPVGNTSSLEWYWQWVNSQGQFSVRPFGITMQRETENAFADFSVSRLAIKHWPALPGRAAPEFDFVDSDLWLNYGQIRIDQFNEQPGADMGIFIHGHSIFTYNRTSKSISLGATLGVVGGGAFSHAPTTAGFQTALGVTYNAANRPADAWAGLIVDAVNVMTGGSLYRFDKGGSPVQRLNSDGEMFWTPLLASGFGAWQVDLTNALYGFMRGSGRQDGISFRNAVNDDGTGVGVRIGLNPGQYVALGLQNGFTDPLTFVHRANGNTEVAGDIEITDSAKGLILRSPNGNRWRVGVSNLGMLTVTNL
jgi:hypothetical protein